MFHVKDFSVILVDFTGSKSLFVSFSDVLAFVGLFALYDIPGMVYIVLASTKEVDLSDPGSLKEPFLYL